MVSFLPSAIPKMKCFETYWLDAVHFHSTPNACRRVLSSCWCRQTDMKEHHLFLFTFWGRLTDTRVHFQCNSIWFQSITDSPKGFRLVSALSVSAFPLLLWWYRPFSTNKGIKIRYQMFFVSSTEHNQNILRSLTTNIFFVFTLPLLCSPYFPPR